MIWTTLYRKRSELLFPPSFVPGGEVALVAQQVNEFDEKDSTWRPQKGTQVSLQGLYQNHTN